MKTIIISFRSLFRKGRNNLIKILSLSVGLAMALVLIAKVYFEQSFDDFFPDAERIYRIEPNYTMGSDETKQYTQTSGAVAVGMKDEIPEVEKATRYTYIAGDEVCYTEDKKKHKGYVVLADSCLLDVFQLPILAGDGRESLRRPMYALVSAEMAEQMGGVEYVVGRTFRMESYPGKTLTIGGVFKTLPKNTHMEFNVLISMASIKEFTWDGSLNWIGNDRYLSYVKLAPGATPESIRPGVERVREKYLDKERLEKSGIDIDYTLMPLLDIHTSNRETTQMMWLLGVLAFALLFAAVMNYLLVVISALVNRSKEMAVHKCYGASDGNIYGRMLAETLVDILVSLLVGGVLIYAFRGAISSLLGAEIGDLFTPESSLLLAGVCLTVFLVAGLVPGYLYAHVPVAMAFRRFSENRRRWKLGLLFVQFIAAGFFVTLLAVVGNQYQYMIDDDPGYAYDNLAYVNLNGLDGDVRRRALEEISRLPEAARVTSADFLLLEGYFSGNNIRLPGDDRDLFNIADFYSVGDGFLDVMEIPVVEGRSFTEGADSLLEVMVSRSFVERMQEFADWSDGAVGKSVFISEHSQMNSGRPFTICGVFEDVRIGVIGRQDSRPSVMFHTGGVARNLLVKLHQQTPEAMSRVSERLAELLPDKTVALYSWPAEMVNQYSDSRKFRDSVMIGGIVTLLICLIGLLGYTNDEMNRRRKETAIRKINGATAMQIERLFLTDISRMALPALVLGCASAWYVAEGWLEKFADKASLSFLLFAACGLASLLVILSAVALNCYRIANENPALNIRSE
jgi:putative ABC transport system permease protein